MTFKQVEKIGNRILLFAICVTALFFLLCSCGSRKVETSKETVKEEVTKTVKQTETETATKQTETNTKVTTDVKIDKENNVVSEVTEIVAKDETKPASVKLPNGQVIDLTNAKYRNVKTTDLSKEKKSYLSEYQKTSKELENVKKQRDLALQQVTKLEAELRKRDSERESFNYWWLWILILGALYLGYRKLRRTNVI
jgi:lipopolysaccharide export LptBFGC system permease protein LptF